MRARQRSRANAFVGFDKSFLPQPHEWGVDRIVVVLTGEWRAFSGNGQNLFHNRFDDPELNWLLRPVGRGYRRSVETRSKGAPLTVGHLKVVATRCSAEYGPIAIEATLNPTRTLSALLVRFGDQRNFADFIAALPALDFFRKPPLQMALPRSLDGADNYLPDHPAARFSLPPDPFAEFMPIYLSKLQALLARAISATPNEMRQDGAEQVFRAEGEGEIRLNWASVEVP